MQATGFKFQFPKNTENDDAACLLHVITSLFPLPSLPSLSLSHLSVSLSLPLRAGRINTIVLVTD